MKTTLKLFLLCTAAGVFISCKQQTSHDKYLQKVLTNLEDIQSATYYEISESWQHGDSTAMRIYRSFIQEYDNPADTTIGASCICLDADDHNLLKWCYDGNIVVRAFHENNGVIVDDFTSRDLPFRPTSPPFFNYTKNIIRYMLTTTDSIETVHQESEQEHYFQLTIHADRQVEFFGKAHYIPENPYIWDPTSRYELWISKSNNLPYKVRREMAHDISVTTCTNLELNTLDPAGIKASDYIPAGYEVRMHGEKRNSTSVSSLIGKKAPEWNLENIDKQSTSLQDFTGKVLLVNFTGIGCGPCQASIPFLKSLKESFNSQEFELVAIETWTRNPQSIKNYTLKNGLNYPMLSATEQVITDYQTGGSAPVFFILDQQRVIKEALMGYTPETTDQKIMDTINQLLGHE